MNTRETTCQRQSLFIHDQQLMLVQRRLRMRGFLRTALLGLVVLLALPAASFAQSALTDDADSQNGTTSNLTLTPTSNVYLKFKLSSTLPLIRPAQT
jgi:hypothetical protein